MNQSAVDIERIVREVVAQLQTELSHSAQRSSLSTTNGTSIQNPASIKSSTAKNTVSKQAESKQLQLTELVITAKQVDGKLKNIQEVIIPAGAVLTPAAKDLLNDAKVRWTEASSLSNSSEQILLLGVVNANFSPANVIQYFKQKNVLVEQTSNKDLVQVINEFQQFIESSNSLGVLLTEKIHAAVCLANRHQHVRAAYACDLQSLAEALNSIRCNLLIVNPTEQSIHSLKNLLLTFSQSKQHHSKQQSKQEFVL